MTDPSRLDCPDPVAELPPSAKYCYKTVRGQGPMTTSELAEATWLAQRTVRHAVAQLEDAGVVTVTQRGGNHNERTVRPAKHAGADD